MCSNIDLVFLVKGGDKRNHIIFIVQALVKVLAGVQIVGDKLLYFKSLKKKGNDAYMIKNN